MQTRLTFVNILQKHSRERNGQEAFRFLRGADGGEQAFTFGELHERALGVGALLARSGVRRGGRVVLLYPPGLDFVAALFGCLYAGAVAVPAAASPRLSRTSLRLLSIIRDARPRLGLTDASTLPLLDALALRHPEASEVRWVATDRLGPDASRGFEPAAAEPGETAMIQYTSGSTSAPKGVMLTHANLVHNQEAMREAFGQDERSVLVGWLPQFHDMGLIGFILHPAYLGASAVLLSPASFLQRPARWLEAVTRFRATATGGPDFGFDLCVRKVTPEERERLDLGSLRAVVNGSEPVRHETLRRFLETFAPCGLRPDVFYPSYGLAEATLVVTAPAEPSVVWADAKTLERGEVNVVAPESPRARPLVGCGRALAGQKVRIVHPDTRAACDDGRVGEIWVSGESVGRGYWDAPEQSYETFHARLAEDDGSAYLRTGDLGFMLGGQLYFAGRLRDLIIVRGQNIYPHDVELTVERGAPLARPGTCAAFGVSLNGAERLVVALEARGLSAGQRGELVAAVRRAIAADYELDVYAVALLRPGALPKTSSGKIRRSACREAFLEGRLGEVFTFEHAPAAASSTADGWLEGELLSLPPERRAESLETHLRALLSELLRVPAEEIKKDGNILAYGVDSLLAVEFLHQIEERLGRPVPAAAALLGGLTLTRLSAEILSDLNGPPPAPQPERPAGEEESRARPLSYGQRALWFISCLAPDDVAYNIGGALRVHAELDAQTLRRALGALLRRHAALRTTFEDSPQGPAQRVHQNFDVPFETRDASGWTEVKLAAAVSEEFHRPFGLSEELPLRVSLFARSPAEHVLLLVVHHIAADFWSLGIIGSELAELYQAEAEGREPSLRPLRRDYDAHVRRQEAMLNGPEGERLWRYWERQLKGAGALNLLTDRPRPPGLLRRGARLTTLLDESLTGSVVRLAREHGTTPFVVLLSAFHILLHRYTRQGEVHVGTPSAGRSGAEFDGVVGYFANPVVMRSRLAPEDDCETFLRRMRRTTLDALEHADFPFPLLVERLQPQRSLDVSPVIQTQFVWRSAPSAYPDHFSALAFDLPGVKSSWGPWEAESVRFERRAAQFDLTLSMAEYGGRLVSSFEYRPELFDRESIERLQGHFANVLRAMAAGGGVKVSRLPLLTDAERAQFEEWNDTAVTYEEEHVLQRLFERQAARRPEADALVLEGRAVSFGELDARANQLAHHLAALGVRPGDAVGVLLEPGAGMSVGLLAALKAGGAYVPLDPSFPPERLRFMYEDARTSAIVTDSEFVRLLGDESARVVRLDADRRLIEARPRTADGLPAVAPDNLAYVIYTSGSTGRPKGVEVSHRAICNRLLWMRDEYDVTPSDRVLQKTPYTFDVSVWEIFLPLITGASMVVAPAGARRDPAQLVDLIRRQKVSLVHFVPPMLGPFLDEPGAEKCASLRHVICSGEALSPGLQKQFFGKLDAGLHNLYGPTEAAVDVTRYVCRRGDESASVPIGRPIANCQVYVLDEQLSRVPVGHPGELYIGGAGLAVGYRGRPALTAASFIPNPFAAAGPGRLYRTGDRALYLADGSLEFLGRLDQQVKVRGFRIEPGEIEAALSEHPSVSEAAVLARRDATGQGRLVAYVVRRPGARDGVEAWREFLRARLPDYMVPAVWVELDELPLTPNGKLDRKALPAPAEAWPAPAGEFAAPETPAERELARIWREVLGVARVGVDDNFFELGGDSIRVLQVRSLARRAGYDFSVQQLFEAPTVRRLSPLMTKAAETLVDSPAAERFGLLSEEARRSLPAQIADAYPLSRLQEALVFHSHSNSDYEVYVVSLHVRAPFEADAFGAALSKVVARHDLLRASYFLTAQGDYVQLINRHVPLPFEVRDLRHLPPARQESAVRESIDRQRAARFDWGRAPLWRLLVHLRDDSTFQLTLAHPLYDGWSVASMLVELFAEHLGRPDGGGAQPSPRARAGFRDFIAAERAHAGSEEARAFWRDGLRGCAASLLPRQPSSRFAEGGEYVRAGTALPPRLVEAAKRLARSEQVPLKSVMLAAHLRVVGLLTGQTQVLTGLITNGRLDEPDADKVVGVFLNTLALKGDLSAASWAALVRDTFRAEQALWPYRHFPLAELRSMLGALPFDTAFNFIHLHLYDRLKDFREFSLLGWESPSDRTYFPLCAYFNLDPLSSELFFFLDYDTRYLSAPEVENIQGYYLNTLAAMTERPDEGVRRRPLLSPAETRRQLDEWNDRHITRPPAGPTHRLFEARAAETPGAVAVASDGVTLTYSELNRRANQLARHLRGLGVGTETPVGVCLGRGAELVVGTLAVLKAGGAYVPLDPSFPRERLTYMLADSGAPVVVTRGELCEAFDGLAVKLVLLDRDAEAVARQSDADPEGGAAPDNLAYVIYTSGSTGRPKGVEVSHASLCNVLLAVSRVVGLGREDVLLSVTTLAFDISALELFMPLVTGASVYVASAEDVRDGHRLLELLESSGANVMQATPATWRLLLGAGWRGDPRLRVLCGGEPLARELADELSAAAGRVWNVYGPTETTVWSTASEAAQGTGAPDIGRPLANTTTYVLDPRMNLLPAGVAGELYIGGEGLARGYRGRHALTAERFVPDPFSLEPGARLYRTGDSVRYGEGGALEFLGRLDHQIKLRGFRIDAGEIEALLAEHPGVGEAVVVARDAPNLGRRLVAYVTPSAGRVPSSAELRGHLARLLPPYMVPSAFVVLDELPLTPNGKVDRSALPEPSAANRPPGDREEAAPPDGLRRRLAEVWREVLRLDEVKVNDNFFDLGGDSLLALKLQNRLAAEAGVDVPPLTLFRHPTVKLLAEYLERGGVEVAGGGDGERRAGLRRSLRGRAGSAADLRRASRVAEEPGGKPSDD